MVIDATGPLLDTLVAVVTLVVLGWVVENVVARRRAWRSMRRVLTVGSEHLCRRVQLIDLDTPAHRFTTAA